MVRGRYLQQSKKFINLYILCDESGDLQLVEWDLVVDRLADQM